MVCGCMYMYEILYMQQSCEKEKREEGRNREGGDMEGEGRRERERG